jgi:hypothetical protein
MARKPDERPRLQGADHERATPEGELERLGPVTIERLSKEDGRALVVYRVAEPAES